MSCNSRFSIEKQGKVTAVNHIGSYWCCVIFNRGTLPCTALLEVSRAFFLPAVVIGVISSPGSLGWARSDQEMETETGTAEQHLSSAGKKNPNTNQTRKKKNWKRKKPNSLLCPISINKLNVGLCHSSASLAVQRKCGRIPQLNEPLIHGTN